MKAVEVSKIESLEAVEPKLDGTLRPRPVNVPPARSAPEDYCKLLIWCLDCIEGELD